MSDVERALHHRGSGALVVVITSEDQPLDVPLGWEEVPVHQAHVDHAVGRASIDAEYEAHHAAAVADKVAAQANADADRIAAAERIADGLGLDVADVLTMFQTGGPA